jgi:hypothetical protein
MISSLPPNQFCDRIGFAALVFHLAAVETHSLDARLPH